MSIQAINYFFFVIFIPLVIIILIILNYLKEEKYKYHRFALICIILLIGHIILPFYNMGIFPYLKYDYLFYFLLFLVGIIFTSIFLLKIEKKSFLEIGWQSSNIVRDIGIGIIVAIFLLFLSAILTLSFNNINFNDISLNYEKILTITFFALGAIYEEILFRGILQKELEEDFSLPSALLIQAFLFLSINLFYFPFDALGFINYCLIFIMAILFGLLAYKYSLYCSTTAHILFVLIAGLFI